MLDERWKGSWKSRGLNWALEDEDRDQEGGRTLSPEKTSAKAWRQQTVWHIWDQRVEGSGAVRSVW